MADDRSNASGMEGKARAEVVHHHAVVCVNQETVTGPCMMTDPAGYVLGLAAERHEEVVYDDVHALALEVIAQREWIESLVLGLSNVAHAISRDLGELVDNRAVALDTMERGQ